MSLYKKPKVVRYVDMCIYIDNNAYREDLTEGERNLIYEYLYHLAKMLAYKANYFKRVEYYEDFSIYFASWLYLRLTNPKQFIIDEETGEPKLERVKSILNYMKNVIYMRKVDFEQENYSQAISPKLEEEYHPCAMEYSYIDKLSETLDEITADEFSMCLGDICNTIKAFLKRIPYKQNTVVWNNIYLSCLLTFLNTVTLSNRTLRRLNKLKGNIINRDKAWSNLYKTDAETQVILYHLDDSLHDYIWVLVQEAKHLIAKDLSLTSHTYIPYTSAINLIAMSDINLEEFNNYGD